MNNTGESEHPCLLPDLRGNVSFFFTIDNNVYCKLIIYMAFTMFPSMLIFLRTLLHRSTPAVTDTCCHRATQKRAREELPLAQGQG